MIFRPLKGLIWWLQESHFQRFLGQGVSGHPTAFGEIHRIKLLSDSDTENSIFTSYSITYSNPNGTESTIRGPLHSGHEASELVLSRGQSVSSISLGRRRPPGGGNTISATLQSKQVVMSLMWRNPLPLKNSTFLSRRDSDLPDFTDPM